MENKITYPFKKFVKNIIIGIILILSVFCIVPISNGAFSNDGLKDENVMAYDTVTIRVMGYNENGTISELGTVNWGWSGVGYYAYGGTESCRIYHTTDLNKTDLNSKKDYAIKPNKQISAGTVKFLPQTNKGFHVVGVFHGNAYYHCISENLIALGDTATLGQYNEYIVLVCWDKYKINFNVSHYLASSEYSSGFETNILGTSDSISVGVGTSSSVNSDIKDIIDTGVQYQFLINNNTDQDLKYFYRHDVKFWIYQNNQNAWWLGIQSLNDQKILNYQINDGFTISVKEVVNYGGIKNDGITKDGSTLIFNIYDEGDLQRFVSLVNDGTLNSRCDRLGYKYKAVLQKDISSYTGDPIGMNDNSGCFKGTFDGNGKKISTVSVSCFSENFTELGGNDNHYKFGLFGYLTGTSSVENLTIGEIKVKNHKYYDNNSYYVPWVETNEQIIPSYQDADVGAICAINKGGKILNCTVENFSPTIKIWKTGFKFGSIVGYMEGGSISNCTVENVNLTANTSFGISDKGDYKIGGIVGDANNVSIVNSVVKNFNVKKSSWAKPDGSNFYAGGLVGYATGCSISSCQVTGGEMNFTDIYLTEQIGIGGLAGYFERKGTIGSLEKCLSQINIVIESMQGGGSNANADYGCIGGFIGISNGGVINQCRYVNEKELILKSGAGNNGITWPFDWNKARNVAFGGMIGWQQSSDTQSNIIDSYVYIPNGVNSANTSFMTYYFGLAVGYGEKSFSFGGTYEGKDTGNYIIIGSSNKNTLDKSGTSVEMYSSGIFGGGLDPTLSENKFYAWNTNAVASWAKDSEWASNGGSVWRNTEIDNTYNKLFNNIYKNNSVTAIGNLAQIFGYNAEIQENWLDSDAGPFLLGTEEYSKYINIMINCTKKEQQLKFNNNYTNNSKMFVFETEVKNGNESVSVMKYLYGTAVKVGSTNYSINLPYLKCGSATVAYYSLYENGRDGDGNVSIFAKPGDTVSYDVDSKLAIVNGKTQKNLEKFSHQENYTLYPIFEDMYTIKSATRLTGNNRDLNKSSWKFENNNKKIEIYETSINEGFYIWEYTIVFDNGNQKLTADKVRSWLHPVYNETTNLFSQNYNAYVSSYAISSAYQDYFARAFLLKNLSHLRNCAKDCDGVDVGGTAYYNIAKNVSLYYGELIKDNGEFIKDGSTYAGNYSQLKIDDSFNIPLFVAGLLNGETQQWEPVLDLSKLVENYEATADYIKDLGFTENNAFKLCYSWKNALSLGEPSRKTVNYNGSIYSSLGIYTSTNSANKDYAFSQDEYLGINSNDFYVLYQEPGLFFRYHSQAYDSNDSTNRSYTQDRVEYRFNNGNEITEYTQANGDFKIKVYGDVVDDKGKSWGDRFDFAGWYARCEIENSSNGTTQTKEFYIYPDGLATIRIDKLLVRRYQSYYIDLYPLFVSGVNADNLSSNNRSYSTSRSEIKVSTPEDLVYASFMVNFKKYSGNITLSNSIDMAGIDFVPIGFHSSSSFKSNFYGEGYSILNLNTEKTKGFVSGITITKGSTVNGYLSINSADSFSCGLFGFTNGATISNVNLLNESMNFYNGYCGGVVGNATSTKISKVVVEGYFKGNKVGGICGYAYLCNITECETRFGGKFSGVLGSLACFAQNTTFQNCFDRLSTSTNNDGYDLDAGSSYNELSIRAYYGFYGRDSVDNTVKNCYSGLNVSNLPNSTKITNVVQLTTSVADSKINNFYKNVSTTIWAQDDNINDGLPYLKNVGIVYGKYQINASKYVVTPEDKSRLGLSKNSGYSNIFVNEQYSLLDIMCYKRTNEDNSGYSKFFDDKISGKMPLTELEGYDYTGFEYKYNDNLKSIIDSVNGNAGLVVCLLHAKTRSSVVINQNFTPKEVKIKYVFKFNDGTTYELDLGNYNFGTNFKPEQINYSTLIEALKQKLKGYNIGGFKIYLPEKNAYLNVDETSGKLIYADESNPNGKYPNFEYAQGLNSAETYKIGYDFKLALIDKISEKNLYNLHLIISEDDGNLVPIEYKLNFFEADQTTEYNVFVENSREEHDYSVNYDSGNINYFIKNYNGVIKAEEDADVQINLYPTYYLTGYTFMGWGYYPQNDKSQKLTKFTQVSKMPDLRDEPYLASNIDEDGTYYLNLYPILNLNYYEITYFDGFEDVKNAPKITTHSPAIAYMNEIQIYGHEKLNDYAVYNRHQGWKVKNFIFTQATINAINKLSDIDKKALKNNIELILKENNLNLRNSTGYDEINDENLCDVCINLINYFFINGENYPDSVSHAFEYFFPCSVGLICIYERIDLKVTVTMNVPEELLGNYVYGNVPKVKPNISMKYEIIDGLTGDIKETDDIVFDYFNTTKNIFILYSLTETKFVKTIKYNDIVNVYVTLNYGTRIKTIYSTGGGGVDLYSFNLEDETNCETFTKNVLSKLSKIEIGNVKNNVINGIKEDVFYTFDINDYNQKEAVLTQNDAGYYEINNENDLVEYAKKTYAYDKVVLTNNINITGMKIYIDRIPENFEFDGNGFTINGYTNFNSDRNHNFINSNYGIIKNLNFDNICVNISGEDASFAIIGTNYGKILSCNVLGGYALINNTTKLSNSNEETDRLFVGGLTESNYGEISKVSCNLEIEVNSEIYSFIAMLASLNYGTINSAVVDGSIKINNDISYASMVVVLNDNNCVINDVIIENANIVSANKYSVVGFILDKTTDNEIERITNVLDYSSLNFVENECLNSLNSSVCKITSESDQQQIKDKLTENTNITLAIDYLTKKEKFVIKDVNVQFVEVVIKNNLGHKNVLFEETMNGISTEKLDDFISKLTFIQSLNNKVIFNSTNASNSSENVYQLDLFVDSEICNNYILTTNKINNEEEKLSNIAKISHSRLSQTECITFEYEAKEFENFNLKLQYRKTAKFSDEEKNLIEQCVNIIVNDTLIEFIFEDGVAQTKNGEKISLKYFDKIEIKFELPALAFISGDNALQINGTNSINTIENSKYQSTYNLSSIIGLTNKIDNKDFKLDEKMNVFAEIDRRAVQLTLDLNKESLTDEIEKDKIKFNADAIKTILTENGYKTKINDEGQLEIEVEPTVESGKVVYLTPEIAKIISGLSVFEYEDNGINYKLRGFAEENYDGSGVYYYNQNCEIIKAKFNDNLTLKAQYEKVRYVIEIQSRDEVNPEIKIKVNNGYEYSSSGKIEKKIYFSDEISVPTVEKTDFNYCYTFVGFKLDDGTENGKMISSASLINGEIAHIFEMGYETLNSRYTIYREDGEFRVILIPVFEENEIDLTFKDGQNADRYNAYLYFETPKDEINRYDEVVVSLTISQVLTNSYALPIGFKEHHKFLGYKLESDEEENLVIAYEDSEFILDNEILSRNNVFVALFEIDNITVTIEMKDFNKQRMLDYEIESLNDVETKTKHYEVLEEEGKIVFDVNYNTTSITLPTIKSTSSDFKFDGFQIVGGAKYTISHKFTENITIQINCLYKVIYQTKMGEITANYKTSLMQDFERVDDFSYSFYASYGQEITLPTNKDENALQIKREGAELAGFKKDGEKLEFETAKASTFVVSDKTEIEFLFDALTYSLTLDVQQHNIELPKNWISNFIESYDRDEENLGVAIIKVVYGTNVNNLKNALPALEKDGYTFTGYLIKDEYNNEINDLITSNGTITSQFVENEYTLVAYDADGTKISEITKHFDEDINSDFYETIETIALQTALENNALFRGLSVNESSFVSFKNRETNEYPQTMPRLEKEYIGYCEHSVGTSIYTLKLYCSYLSNVQVIINANENTKILNENTFGITDFTGGDNFNASATFKLSGDAIISGAKIKLPIVQVKEDSILEFATFIGYSMLIDGEKTLVVDANGYLLDEFAFNDVVILTQEFEFNTYNLILRDEKLNVKDNALYGFEKQKQMLIKQVEFNSVIGSLPVLERENYIFIGYYFSNSNDILVGTGDVKISDENGILLEDFEILNKDYFNKTAYGYELKDIYAKYEIKQIKVTIKTENIKLGNVYPITSTSGNSLPYNQIENGYEVNVPSGTDVIVLANINELVATFKGWRVLLNGVDVTNTIEIDNIESISTIVRNVTENLEIIAEFSPKTFTITYVAFGEEQNLSPNEFTVLTPEITLPTLNIYGYTFKGWFLEEEYINKRETINPVSQTSDITLYGKIENKQVEINIYSNNIEGYTLHSSISVKFNTIIENLPNLTIKGYRFIGFFTNEDATGVKISNQSLSIFVENVDVYAYFEKELEFNLSGKGTETNPYQIHSKEDFKVFVQYVEKQNSTNKYFILCSSIELNETFVISQFDGTFDGNGQTIYLSNSLNGFNQLTTDGKIEKNVSLFGENNGTIKNLILAVKQTEIFDVFDESFEYFENYFVNLSTIANKNNGEIINNIVYFSISTTIDFSKENNNFAEICFENEDVTNCSIYASKLNSQTFENVLEGHLFANTLTSISKNADGIYEVSTAEEFAYLLYTNFAEEVKISLKNNLNFNGKILEKTTNNISINANGYILSGMTILNQEYMFENLSLMKTAIENAVILNFNDECKFIKSSQQISNSYIELTVSNCNNLIDENNGEIQNAYFVVSQIVVINSNNGNLANVYTIGAEKLYNTNSASLENVTSFDIENLEGVEEFILNAKTKNAQTNQTNLWFEDKDLIMSNFVLPKLIGVGNVVTELLFDEDLLEIEAYKYTITEDKLIITKNNEEIILSVSKLSNQINLSDIKINGESKLENLNKVLSIFTISETALNYNTCEFITILNSYEVVIEVDTKNVGNLIKVGEEQGEKIVISAVSGTKLDELNIEPIANKGYVFAKFEMFDQSGELIESENPEILSNTKIIAKFEKLIEYNLILSSQTNIVVQDNKLTEFWTEKASDEYVIYLGVSENVEEYLPKLMKQDYKFISFSILKIGELEYKILPNFEADYVNLKIKYETTFGYVEIESENENSLQSPELKIVEKLDEEGKEYKVLRGYNIKMLINFNGTYLIKAILNDVDLFEDYSQFFEKEDEIVKEISLDETLNEHTIEIIFDEIMVETKFVFNADECSLALENATINLTTFIVKTRKNFDLQFILTCADNKEIESIKATNSQNEELDNLTTVDEIYHYITTENSTIVILLKNKVLNVVVSSSIGGEVKTNENIEITQIDETTFSFFVEYNESFDLTINSDDGYKPKSIMVNGKSVAVETQITIEEVCENQNIEILFEKLSTWLDMDENGVPTHFNISTFKGKGTEANPYQISSFNDFLTIVYNANILNQDYTNTYFKTTNRDMKIDLSTYYFTPIKYFNGTILGDNLTLSGIKIYSSYNASLVSNLGKNGCLKAINITGNIEGNYFVAGLVSENNGTIIGCSNNCEIVNLNNIFDEKNITAGICAINNGTITRSYNAGEIQTTSIKTAGICAINNGTVDNVYNEGMIIVKNTFALQTQVAGICAINKNIVQIGYNNSRIVNQSSNKAITISGSVINAEGGYQNIYYNSNKLSVSGPDAKTFSELSDKENEIYQNFDLTNIWQFIKNKKSPPILTTCYEYVGKLTFMITFDDNLTQTERLALAEITSETGETYGLILQSQNKVYMISNLTKGTYTIRLKTLLGNNINLSDNSETSETETAGNEANNLTIDLNESKGDEVEIHIMLTKGKVNGYYGFVII